MSQGRSGALRAGIASGVHPVRLMSRYISAVISVIERNFLLTLATKAFPPIPAAIVIGN